MGNLLVKRNMQVLDILQETRAEEKDRLQSYLRNNNISINLKTRHGQTALYLAAELGFLTELTTLIEAGANVNISTSRFHKNTPIMAASKHGRFKCLQALIKSGAQVNDLNKDGKSALMLAIGKVDCFKALIEAGACVNQRTSSGVPVLDLVSSREEMQALIKAGADVTDHTLMLATNIDFIQLLLSKGISLNKQDHLGSTALMYLCQFYTHLNMKDTDLKAVQALLEAGLDVNITDHSGRTALMMAAEAGNHITVETLLQAKAHPDIQDRDGNTALMYAKDKACIKVLISYGANMELQNNLQNTALILALKEYHNFVGMFNMLLDNGANPVIYGPQRSWLHKIFLLEQGKYTHKGHPENIIWQTIAYGNKRFLRFLVCNGIMIDYSKIDLKPSRYASALQKQCFFDLPREKSAVGKALKKRQLDEVKYLMVNCFLTYDDLKDMRTSLYEIRRQWLIKNGFFRCKLNEEHSDQPLNDAEIPLEEIPDEIHKLLQQALNEPWPLVKLAFIAVSSALGLSPGREERIPKTGLPDRLQRMLLFQEPVSRLPVSEWEDIPLTFDPVEYEKLPKPRPLLHHWPVGRDLVI